MRLCDVEGCNAKHLAKGFCKAHYLRLYNHARLHRVVMRGESAHDRIMAKVTKQPNGCWIFNGTENDNGYGMIRLSRGVMQGAHKALYESIHGPVPDGLELDHSCRNRKCVNPEHLEPVTHRINMRRSVPFRSDLQNRARDARGQYA